MIVRFAKPAPEQNLKACYAAGCSGCRLEGACIDCGTDIHKIFELCERCAEKKFPESSKKAKGPIIRRKT